MQPGVLEPQLDVLRRVEHLPLHHERGAVVGDPAGQPLVPRDVAEHHPVGQHLAPAARRQVAGRLADDPLDDLVARQPAVAVDQHVGARRGDDERRVGGDQVEPLAGDGLPERALAQVDRRTSLSAQVSAASRSARRLTSVPTTSAA